MNNGNIPSNDDFDIREAFQVIWRKKFLIFFVTASFSIISVTYALLLPNIYKSYALLAPVAQGDSLSGLASRFGGLASLAGVSLGSSQGSKTVLAMEVIKSRAFLSDLLSSSDMLPALMAPGKWDENARVLSYNERLYDSTKNIWTKDDRGKTNKPTLQKTHKKFLSMVSVTQDKNTGFVTLSFEHQSPIMSRDMVNQMIKFVNDRLRTNDIEQAERSIEFLESQISSTSLSEIRSGLYELVQSQTETIMLAKANPEYVFRVIDPALIPEEKNSPKRALIAIVGTVFGGILGIILVLINHVNRVRN